jgi:hypothetical protein
MKKLLLAALFVACMSNTSFAIDEGTASGTLKLGKNKVEFKHSYAHQYNDEEGLLEGPELRILITDREVPHELLSGYDAAMRIDDWVREEKVRGVLLRFDPKKPSAGMRGTVLYKPADPKASLTFFTSSGNNELRDFAIGNNRVRGKVEYRSDGQGFFKDMPPLEFSASFSAPLFHELPISAKLVGAKAAKSAPAQALIAYYKALSIGDLEAARKGASDERWKQLETHKAQIGDAEFKEMLKQMTNPSELERQINTVFIRGQRALIIIKDATGRSSQSMIQTAGVWKVD